MFVEITAAVERLCVVHYFLNQIERGERVDVDDVFPLGRRFVVCVDGAVSCGGEVFKIVRLGVRQHFGRLVCQADKFAVALVDCNLVGIPIVVDFYKPSACDFFWVADVVGLFGNLYAVGVDADGLGQEVQADVFAVEHHFHRALLRCEVKSAAAAQLEAHRVAEKSEVVVGMGEQCEMLAFLHAEQCRFGVEFEAVWLFVEACECIVAASFDFQCQRFVG